MNSSTHCLLFVFTIINEIASEFGVNFGADITAHANGSVGCEITKRLVQMAEQKLGRGRF